MGEKDRAKLVSPVRRIDGYAPIRDYAVIGDGRTLALVARDGSIDWLAAPNLDSPTVFGALLDARQGGEFSLAPDVPYEAERRYLPGTNVLETTFKTNGGVVRVTDGVTLPVDASKGGLFPSRELYRGIEAMSGSVPLTWRVEPRFGYSTRSTRISRRRGVPVATSGSDAMAICAWGAGDPVVDDRSVRGRFVAQSRSRALIALTLASEEPLILPTRQEVEGRLTNTVQEWKRWAEDGRYEGPWRPAVIRSALVLKLLVFAPSGAVAAAPTTSLPEEIGGDRNWDYRFCWVRDSAFTLNAFLALGCSSEADAFFWWLMQASQISRPRLQVLYRLDGGADAAERTLPLAGYRGSRPVRIGNGALDQLQLSIYGDLFQTAWLYAHGGNRIDRDIGRRLAATADLVLDVWSREDAGIWEVRSKNLHFTESKMMCALALERAASLANEGQIPGRHAERWRRGAAEIRNFVETRCWSDAKRAYIRAAGLEELDASVLLGGLFGYCDPKEERMRNTVDAIRRELAEGPFVYRYSGEDGLVGNEGAFLACSFWVVEALARCGRTDEAGAMMDELVGLANDVGLYAEEIDPGDNSFLGNFPQGLTHLALVNAAVALTRERSL